MHNWRFIPVTKPYATEGITVHCTSSKLYILILTFTPKLRVTGSIPVRRTSIIEAV